MFYFKYEKRTRSLTRGFGKRNTPLSKSDTVVYFELNKQCIFLFLCVLKGFCGKNPLLFNLSDTFAKENLQRIQFSWHIPAHSGIP